MCYILQHAGISRLMPQAVVSSSVIRYTVPPAAARTGSPTVARISIPLCTPCEPRGSPSAPVNAPKGERILGSLEHAPRVMAPHKRIIAFRAFRSAKEPILATTKQVTCIRPLSLHAHNRSDLRTRTETRHLEKMPRCHFSGARTARLSVLPAGLVAPMASGTDQGMRAAPPLNCRRSRECRSTA